jgi:hypothetical protein
MPPPLFLSKGTSSYVGKHETTSGTVASFRQANNIVHRPSVSTASEIRLGQA